MCFETTRGAVGSPLPAPLVFAVHDPEDPNRVHIVRGSVSGIQALQALLKQRFQDGHALGLAQGKDRLEQLEGALRELLQRLQVQP